MVKIKRRWALVMKFFYIFLMLGGGLIVFLYTLIQVISKGEFSSTPLPGDIASFVLATPTFALPLVGYFVLVFCHLWAEWVFAPIGEGRYIYNPSSGRLFDGESYVVLGKNLWRFDPQYTEETELLKGTSKDGIAFNMLLTFVVMTPTMNSHGAYVHEWYKKTGELPGNASWWWNNSGWEEIERHLKSFISSHDTSEIKNIKVGSQIFQNEIDRVNKSPYTITVFV